MNAIGISKCTFWYFLTTLNFIDNIRNASAAHSLKIDFIHLIMLTRNKSFTIRNN